MAMGKYYRILTWFSCAADCKAIERGWKCPTPGAKCQEVCGDGYYVGQEVCDDKNSTSGDGCYSDCRKIESGWACTGVNPPGTHAIVKDTCAEVCGDSKVVGKEACDDGN